MRTEVHKMLVTITLELDESEGVVGAKAEIGVEHPPLPFAVAMVAAEQFMTMVALESEAGFDKALESLCEGARTNKVKMFQGNQTQ